MTRLLQRGPSAQAEQRSDAPALVFQGETLTYGELEAESNRLARLLRETGCRRGDRVAIMMAKSPTAIASMLGVLKADCVYVPIDVSMPAKRATKILVKSEADTVLAAGQADRLLAEVVAGESVVGHLRIGWMDQRLLEEQGVRPTFTARDLGVLSPEPRSYENSSHDAAHILFTSGSTGEPKGVVITHENVLQFLDWAIPYFGITEADRNSGHPPLHFDLSTFDVYGSLTAGAQLHLMAPELSLLPHKLASLVRESDLTQWFSVPSILNYMAKFEVVKDRDFPTLKRVLWCGEVFPTPALTYWMKRLPHVRFTNLYGPTEATIASSYYTVPRCPESETAAIPIGTPCPGETLLVLDDTLKAVRSGEVGDLYISGVGLSPGYWKDSEKTSAAFLPDPRGEPAQRIYRTGDLAMMGEDGLVYYLGRADSQIKSRGYRIELGEIETALNSIGSLVENAVVGVESDGFEGTTICCAYVSSRDHAVDQSSLRKQLSEALPSYMLPSRWLVLERLPKNANGKIDRRALKDAFLRGDDRRGGPS